MKPRKIVQLTHAYYGRGETETFALADDGTLWVMSAKHINGAWEYSWEKPPWPPLPPIEEPEGEATHHECPQCLHYFKEQP